MIVAGLYGGVDRVGENRFAVPRASFHDAACVLLENGVVKAAIEEERFNRIKHTNKYPRLSLRFCLAHEGLDVTDLDCIAFGVRESYLDEVLRSRHAMAPTFKLQAGRQYLQGMIEEDCGVRVDPRRFQFVDHHLAHACSAFYPSGFERALVFTADGVGDSLSGSIYKAEGNRLTLLDTIPEEDSLGLFYLNVTRYLGYDLFDEYKVMGLAPYGDPGRFEAVLQPIYELLPGGRYRFDAEELKRLKLLLPARNGAGELSQTDKDVAMAAQVVLERIALHILEHYRRETGLENLCLAGGVALNCKMNGSLLRNGMFRDIFVQPAAHDAGVALGSALLCYANAAKEPARIPQMRHVYWGGHCGEDQEIESLLQRWSDFVTWERVSAPCAAAARLMAAGEIIGWAQGRSEFGPRALGNRSILADPRPASNKDVINGLVKKREAFRPFAPSALAEYALEYFDIPAGASFPFMLFVVPVREEHREKLGAITHVDGSARLHTVCRADNETYWNLIDCFRQLTGIPMVLNTSFNNFAEPIVESAADCLQCFLTTGLRVLVLENWIVRKKPRPLDALLTLKPLLRPYAQLNEVNLPVNGANAGATKKPRKSRNAPPIEETRRVVANTFDQRIIEVPKDLFVLLLRSDGYRSLAELMDECGLQDMAVRLAFLCQTEDLWERRLLSLEP